MEDNLLDELDFEEDTQKDKYFIFTVGESFYGIDVSLITEIIGIHPITQVPKVPDYIKGIINLRGMIIPVMDIRLRFKKDFIPYNERTCIVIVDFDDITIGLLVDSVTEVTEIPDEDIIYKYDINKTSNRFLKGISKKDSNVYMILDCDRLVNDDLQDSLI